MALRFEVLGRFNRGRIAELTLPHYVCQMPLFMPMETQGTIKGLTSSQLEEIGCQIILGNTYHLALRPASELIDDLGGFHKFMNWRRAMLTDSGGFQMVSLLHLVDITEEGEMFQSPVDGKPLLLALRNQLKSNYAIGGRSGGEVKDSFWRVVAQCTAALPEDKPRYVIGVGYPLDIVVCSALGADMYDCVYPARTARFGMDLVPEGVLILKHHAMADDTRAIDPTCTCMVCKNYSRAYIHCLVTKDAMGSQLLSYHNLYYMMKFPKGDVCNAMEVAGIDISSCCAPFLTSQD